MRAVLAIAGLALVAGLPANAGPPEGQAVALAGCCMERQTLQYPWYNNGKDFDQCVAINADKDGGDNIYEETGLIWWYLAC